MFSRAVLLACVAGSAVAIIDEDSLNAEVDGFQSCGNCFKQVPSGTATPNPLRCNSGGHADKIPFSTNQDPNAAPITAGDLAEHGYNKATAMSVNMMRQLVGEEWKLMFCSSHLDMYKYEATENTLLVKHQGVGCVRDASREAILAADKEARKHYIEFGTENGYPSAYAMVKSQHLSDEAIKFGVDGEGDIPSNWCSVYMRSMLCQVAFPQVILDPKAVDNKLSKGQVEEARGKVRSVEYDSCKNIFNHCNRKAPWSEETKSSHVSPLFKNNMGRALFIEDTVGELENKIDVSFYCEAWRKGWGLAAAGTGVSDQNTELTVKYEAGSSAVASMLLVIVGLVAALL
eukprot:Rhum_TRINITY_DN24805_c0_g1::Rhum_TRINITY_DN24805_c0_g1_i1::g.180223::m.180223